MNKLLFLALMLLAAAAVAQQPPPPPDDLEPGVNTSAPASAPVTPAETCTHARRHAIAGQHG